MKRREGSYLTSGTIARFVFFAVTAAVFAATYIMFSRSAEIADNYSQATRAIALILSGAMSYVPFSVAEVLLYVLVTTLLIYLAVMIVRMCQEGHVFARIMRVVANLAVWASLLALLFLALYGSNYFATPLADKMDLTVKEQTVEELEKLTLIMQENANSYAAIVPRDDDGFCEFGSFADIAQLIGSGYEALEDDYDFIEESAAPVKSVTGWRIMSAFGIAGMFVPYTGESLVNPDTPDEALPFHMAHEMAHRTSIAPEDEANFMAFLACRANKDRKVVYSGYFMAYRYCINALYDADYDTWKEVVEGANDYLHADLSDMNRHIEQYEGPVSDIGDAVNDKYLKSYGQTEGTASYGLMVDLLIAEYSDQLN